MRTSDAVNVILPALIKARGEFPTLRKRGNNPDTNSKYVKLDDLVLAIVPVLRKYDVLVMQSQTIHERIVSVATRFFHVASSQWVECDSAVPLVGRTLKGGAKGEADPQSGGSATSYARRYGLATALVLVADVDDDGRAARAPEPEARPVARQQDPKALDLAKNKERLKKARAYKVGTFVMPFDGKPMTDVPVDTLKKLHKYAKDNELYSLATDVEMSIKEISDKGAADAKEPSTTSA